MRWEMREGGGGGDTVVVDAHAVVECFFPELLARVVEDCFREESAGERYAGHFLGFGRFKVFFVAEEGGNGARLRGPAVD